MPYNQLVLRDFVPAVSEIARVLTGWDNERSGRSTIANFICALQALDESDLLPSGCSPRPDELHSMSKELQKRAGADFFRLNELECLLDQQSSQEVGEEMASLLCSAAAADNADEIARLLQGGAEVDGLEKSGLSPLMHACTHGSVRALQLLLRSGAMIDKPCAVDGWSALMKACAKGHLVAVQMLMEARADPNVQAFNGGTALLLARYYGHTEVAAWLGEHGADASIDWLSPLPDDARTACRPDANDSAMPKDP
mmetsp:Transcript_44942/g.74583  ORF Transcript_44942/g.74583 Transcript_44942/m.74583 type:complete len:255 (+) Transcript_44942:64-828(+)